MPTKRERERDTHQKKEIGKVFFYVKCERFLPHELRILMGCLFYWHHFVKTQLGMRLKEDK